MASPVRLGLIGVGRWGKVYIKNLLTLSDCYRISHLCTSNPANAALVSHPVTVVSSWQELLTSDCDAVIIATPPATHAEILEGCVGAGKPCLIEKPLCLDVPTAERLHRLVQQAGVPVLVDQTHLFHPAYRALKRMIEERREPVRVVISEGMAFGPFRDHTAALWDWGPHDVSLCLDLLGEMPQRLDALAGPVDPNGSPEQISLRLDFASGVCAWMQIGRLAPQKRRLLHALTDTRAYWLDELATEPLTTAPIEFSARYRHGIPGGLTRTPIALDRTLSPMTNLLTAFHQGLSGGNHHDFGTALARDVVQVLSACEQLLKTRAPIALTS